MGTPISRRPILAAMGAGVAALAFDPLVRSWISEAHGRPSAGVAAPTFDGDLLIDGDALARASEDLGRIVRRTPVAVLRPRSVRDIQSLLRYASRVGLTVAVRGQAHSVLGQALAEGGVIIDSSSLAEIHSISPGEATVDAGVRWIDLVPLAGASSLSPRVLPDDLTRSIGGVLSAGGVGGTSHRFGLACDNVLDLEVVTASGEHIACSPDDNPRLFEAVLGGFGQLGVIIRATIPLVEAPARVRAHSLWYTGVAGFVADLRRLASSGSFDSLQGHITPAPGGEWTFRTWAASYYSPPAEPEIEGLFADLTAKRGAVTESEITYDGWTKRARVATSSLRSEPSFNVARPSLKLFLADESIELYLRDLLSEVDPAELGNLPIVFSALNRRTARASQPILPATDVFFSLDLPRFAEDEAAQQSILTSNRALFEKARRLGGKAQLDGAIDIAASDCAEHFGERYAALVLQKGELDPAAILGPGLGIFGTRRSPAAHR